MQTQEFLKKLKAEAHLENDKEATRVTRAVFRALHQRLEEGEADDVEATLPTELKELWRGSLSQWLAKKMGAVDRYGKDVFISRVQTQARMADPEDAENKARAVLHVLKEAIPEGEVADVEAQLPPDLKEFWKAA